MKTNEALKLVGGLSKPSKMPGWAYGLPAKECKTGSKLVNVKGSTCEGCSILWNHYLWCLDQGRDTSWWFKHQAASFKRQAFQAASDKLQGPRTKDQASSPLSRDHGPRIPHKVL
jgi:hypothetical protein